MPGAGGLGRENVELVFNRTEFKIRKVKNLGDR